MFEVTPPGRRVSAATIQKNADKISDAIRQIGCIDFINLPEVIEENRLGEPLYRNMDPRVFGVSLRERTGIELAVNKVTPHLGSIEEFQRWLMESVQSYGIRKFVFVGGSSASVDFPGPSVQKANELAHSLKEVTFGNICIPTREDEAKRLLIKTASHCSFFTTQVIFEPGHICKVLKDYSAECTKAGVKPVPFYLSFAPLSEAFDVDFCKWLGAFIPPEKEANLKGSGDIASESIRLAIENYGQIISFASLNFPEIPLCLNIEPLSMHNLGFSVEMASSLIQMR